VVNITDVSEGLAASFFRVEVTEK